MSPELGSLEWTQQTDGRLTTWREHGELLWQAIKYQTHTMQGRLAAALLGPRRSRADLDLDEVRPPTGRAAREAERLVNAKFPPVWANHSRRCYLWGLALGRSEGLEFDEEALYVAALLHDVALAEPTGFDGRCFSLPAAEEAGRLAREAGWAPPRRRLVADAITRHLNLWVSREAAPEAYLLCAGAKLDVVGFRYWDVSPRLVDAVLERYPRLGFKDEFRPTLRASAAAAPASRSGRYQRFADRRRANSPFAE